MRYFRIYFQGFCHVCQRTSWDINQLEYKTANEGPGLAVLIEYGHGNKDYYYDYPSSDEFCDPRPFIANTRKRLKKSGKHKEALKNGLKRNNIKTK